MVGMDGPALPVSLMPVRQPGFWICTRGEGIPQTEVAVLLERGLDAQQQKKSLQKRP